MISTSVASALLALLANISAQVPSASAPPLPLTPKADAAIPEEIPGPSARALTKEDTEAWLDGFFPFALQRGDVAGAVVVVVKDGNILLQKGYGFADVAERKPVDPERTLFRAGSVSKLFVWTAVMQLVEQGKLDLDADINSYLDLKFPPRDGKSISLRHLMTHTAGFDEAVRGLIMSNPQDLQPLGDTLKRFLPPLVTTPGSTPAYSNYGTTVAAYIVQRVSGESFDDYIERHIFHLSRCHTRASVSLCRRRYSR